MSVIDRNFPRWPPFGKTLKRLRSNGLAKGEEAKGPVTPEQEISWRKTAKQNGAARSGGLRTGDVVWRPVMREGWRPTVKPRSKREDIRKEGGQGANGETAATLGSSGTVGGPV